MRGVEEVRGAAETTRAVEERLRLAPDAVPEARILADDREIDHTRTSARS
jgi:hypothetical protein